MGYYAERVLDINNVKKRDIIACILTSLIEIGISCFMHHIMESFLHVFFGYCYVYVWDAE